MNLSILLENEFYHDLIAIYGKAFNEGFEVDRRNGRQRSAAEVYNVEKYYREHPEKNKRNHLYYKTEAEKKKEEHKKEILTHGDNLEKNGLAKQSNDSDYAFEENDDKRTLKRGNLTESIINNEIERIADVLTQIKDIVYGFISKKDGTRIADRNWIHNCKNLGDYYEVQTDPEITLKNKLGICTDQSLAIKYLMNKYHPEMSCTLYALMKGRFGHCVPTFVDNGKYYYLENAWDKEKGLHGGFNSEKELEEYLNYIYHKHHDIDNDDDVIIMKYDDYKALKNLNESCYFK